MTQTGTLTADGHDAPSPAGASWTERLRAVGLLLDRESVRVRDACVLDIDGGFVVEAIAEAFSADGVRQPSWVPLSREYTVDDIAAVVAAPRHGRRRR